MSVAIFIKLTAVVVLLGGIYAILYRIDQESHPAPPPQATQERWARQSARGTTGWGKAFRNAR